jgi:hypothetical protein
MRKSSEEVIQQVLVGMRDCEASAGMQGRILDGVQERASAEAASDWRWLRPMRRVTLARPCAMRPLAWGLALGTMMAVFLSISVINRTKQSPARWYAQTVPTTSLASPALGAGAEETRPRLPGSAARSRGDTSAQNRTPINASELVSLRGIRAISRPAPAAPLTKEERILLSIAHTGDPQELAMLNPEIRAQQEAESEAEFERFVRAATKGDRE